MFEQDGRNYAIICVYMPYECNDNEDIYLEKLGVLHSILDELAVASRQFHASYLPRQCHEFLVIGMVT